MVKKVKVKLTLVQALRLCTGRTAHRRCICIALPLHDDDTRRGWGVSITPRPVFTPRKDPVPIVQEAGWAPGLVWTGTENLALTGIRSPDCPAHIQSLYWLRYPAHLKPCHVKCVQIVILVLWCTYLVDNCGSNSNALLNKLTGSNKRNVVEVTTDNNQTSYQQLHLLQRFGIERFLQANNKGQV